MVDFGRGLYREPLWQGDYSILSSGGHFVW